MEEQRSSSRRKFPVLPYQIPHLTQRGSRIGKLKVPLAPPKNQFHYFHRAEGRDVTKHDIPWAFTGEPIGIALTVLINEDGSPDYRILIWLKQRIEMSTPTLRVDLSWIDDPQVEKLIQRFYYSPSRDVPEKILIDHDENQIPCEFFNDGTTWKTLGISSDELLLGWSGERKPEIFIEQMPLIVSYTNVCPSTLAKVKQRFPDFFSDYKNYIPTEYYLSSELHDRVGKDLYLIQNVRLEMQHIFQNDFSPQDFDEISRSERWEGLGPHQSQHYHCLRNQCIDILRTARQQNQNFLFINYKIPGVGSYYYVRNLDHAPTGSVGEIQYEEMPFKDIVDRFSAKFMLPHSIERCVEQGKHLPIRDLPTIQNVREEHDVRTEGNYVGPVRMKSNARIPCSHCNQTFTDSSNARRHRKTKHGCTSTCCQGTKNVLEKARAWALKNRLFAK